LRRAFRRGCLGFVSILIAAGAGAAWFGSDEVATPAIVGISQRARTPVAVPSDVRESFLLERDGVRLRVWLLDPPPPMAARGTILVLHGIHDSKLSSLASARSHARRGYRALVLDSRGHGESSGRFLTYGVEEAKDLRALVDELAERGLLAAPLLVLGSSYGGATAIQFAALDPRVEKVVAIAPFASLREVVPAYTRWVTGGIARLVPARWLNARIDRAARVAGFDPNQACPRCAAPRVRASALIIASTDDERIPWRQAQSIQRAFRAPAQLMLVHGAGHVGVGRAPGVAEAVERWLDAPAVAPR
jgi:pimeloyl-ACP methyl ester carboxylesterase